MKNKKLYRNTDNKMLSGVCSGIGEYFGVDITLIRLVYAFLTIFTSIFPGVILYIVAVIIIPRKSDIEREEVKEAEYTEKSSKSESIFDE